MGQCDWRKQETLPQKKDYLKMPVFKRNQSALIHVEVVKLDVKL